MCITQLEQKNAHLQIGIAYICMMMIFFLFQQYSTYMAIISDRRVIMTWLCEMSPTYSQNLNSASSGIGTRGHQDDDDEWWWWIHI